MIRTLAVMLVIGIMYLTGIEVYIAVADNVKQRQETPQQEVRDTGTHSVVAEQEVGNVLVATGCHRWADGRVKYVTFIADKRDCEPWDYAESDNEHEALDAHMRFVIEATSIKEKP